MQTVQDPRIPVTILTGFLGAGKTTLLNRLIRENPHKRIAIIENEFGEEGIDNELVLRGDESLFAMNAGCICCDLNSELVETLRGVAELPPRPDHLIIETTGIADPTGVVRPFLEDLLTRTAFRLDGVVCVADAAHLELQLGRDPEAIRQIASANWIVLNKSDKVDDQQRQRLQQILGELNSDAQICTAQHGVFEGDPLSLAAWDLHSAGKKWERIEPHHHHHHHIVSHSFVFEEDFDLAALDLWLRQLLQIQGEGIYRTKGIVAIAGVDRKLVFQSVQGDYVAGFTETWGDTPRKSRMVFLGKELRRDILEKRLGSCKAKPRN